MTYSTKTQKVILTGFFLLTILLMITGKEYPAMLYFLIPFSIFILATIFMQFKLQIKSGSLAYQIRLFSLPIYKKEVTPDQIVDMTYKRVSWGQKCIVVQMNKGFNFRIVNFQPDNIYDNLITFADQQGVLIFKTKDFLLLEKLR